MIDKAGSVLDLTVYMGKKQVARIREGMDGRENKLNINRGTGNVGGRRQNRVAGKKLD